MAVRLLQPDENLLACDFCDLLGFLGLRSNRGRRLAARTLGQSTGKTAAAFHAWRTNERTAIGGKFDIDGLGFFGDNLCRFIPIFQGGQEAVLKTLLIASFSTHQQTGFVRSLAGILRRFGERMLFEVNDGFWCSHFNLPGLLVWRTLGSAREWPLRRWCKPRAMMEWNAENGAIAKGGYAVSTKNI
jgi:hypothetical protein